MKIKFTIIHCLAVSVALHIIALGIINFTMFRAGRPTILTGMNNRDMPAFKVTLPLPPDDDKDPPSKVPDVIAVGGQKMPVPQPDTAAVKEKDITEQSKMLNEIIVSTFVKPRPDSIKNSPPAYPYIAQKEGQEGVVILLLEIKPTGEVNSIKVVQSSGYALLDQSAMDAVKKWHFTPATENNKPVLSRIRIPIRFKLIENQ